MKTRNLIVWLVMACCCIALPANAWGLGDLRLNARFLTDRMAFELNLNTYQYDDLYEVNYDFLCGIEPYIDDLAYARAAAMDAYYRYLDERNDDLRWILSDAEYLRFMAIDYFFRPIYAANRICYLRVYQIYPNHSHFYFGRPHHYYSYCGGHSRFHCHGRSFYKDHFSRRYTHAVYGGSFRSRPDFRKHDFGPNAHSGRRPGDVMRPRPGKKDNPGYRFTPMESNKGNRPNMNRPGNNSRPEGNRYGYDSRPNNRNDRKEANRSNNRTNRYNKNDNATRYNNRSNSTRKNEAKQLNMTRPNNDRNRSDIRNNRANTNTTPRSGYNRSEVQNRESTRNRTNRQSSVRPSSTDRRNTANRSERSKNYSRPDNSQVSRMKSRESGRQSVNREKSKINRSNSGRNFLRDM